MDPLEASRLVTDEYSAKILVATFKKPKSAIDLSREYGIPIAATYRRIHALERAGLIRCMERALTQMGKRISLYCSQFKHAYIMFENRRLRGRFHLETGTSKDTGADSIDIDVDDDDVVRKVVATIAVERAKQAQQNTRDWKRYMEAEGGIVILPSNVTQLGRREPNK